MGGEISFIFVTCHTCLIELGAIFNSVPEGTDPTKFDFAGSAVVAVAESKEQVIEQLKEDIYYKEGVWDVDNVSENSSQLPVSESF